MKTLRTILNENLVWAFNINCLIEVKAVAKAASRENKPVVMLISSNAIKYAGLDYLDEITKVAKRATKAPLFVQLDHGKDENLIIECAKRGFDAIMIDGSSMDCDQNIKFVNKIVRRVKKINQDILIEAALGVIGDENDSSQNTDLEQIENFIRETNIDLLAVSIGNKHGFNKEKPKLDRDLLKNVNKKSSVPLVLHGADWISQNDIQFALGNGVRKINIGPELRIRVVELVKEISNSPKYDITDYRKLVSKIIDDLALRICEKLRRNLSPDEILRR
ncbi:class II fructose-bisphosphate aldolase [Candidatus Microgenomates bacterium]|nr:class II fructose-bisphosphate aldolase [Candidatus Microgenomates bacterium]